MGKLLEDKVVLITGASRGIGRALAIGFAKEGATVVGSARTLKPGTASPQGSLQETVQNINEEGGKAMGFPCDISSPSDIKTLINETLAETRRIDVLINNAGINLGGPIDEFTSEDFARVLMVNVQGVFLMCKHVIPTMLEHRGGSIINISSRSAIWEESESLVYGASKAALNRFTLNLASDMKPYNVAVNALGPGLIASAMTANVTSTTDRWGRSPEPPEVVVPSALWLAQQDSSTFTGNIVHRDEFGKQWP